MEVILASKSPRRRQLLQAAGIAIEIRPSHIDESALPEESVKDQVLRLCREKAAACNAPDEIPIIAADTLVCLDDKPLGQPTDLPHARRMLQALAGREHQVMTAVCVRMGEAELFECVTTRVRFRAIDDAEIDNYLLHNEVLDKAGGYAVQGGAATFIEQIDGPLDNVIGLPVATTLHMIRTIRGKG